MCSRSLWKAFGVKIYSFRRPTTKTVIASGAKQFKGRETEAFAPGLLRSARKNEVGVHRCDSLDCPGVVATTDPPSVILADQIKSLDWRARNVIHEDAVSAHVLADVRAKIKALLDL